MFNNHVTILSSFPSSSSSSSTVVSRREILWRAVRNVQSDVVTRRLSEDMRDDWHFMRRADVESHNSIDLDRTRNLVLTDEFQEGVEIFIIFFCVREYVVYIRLSSCPLDHPTVAWLWSGVLRVDRKSRWRASW